MSAKTDALICGTRTATVRLRFDARLLAARLGTYPVATMAASTLARVASDTDLGSRTTRETVWADTPAAAATSDRVTERVAERLRGRRGS